MKRIIALLLVLVTVLGAGTALAGCNNTPVETTDTTQETTESGTIQTTETETTATETTETETDASQSVALDDPNIRYLGRYETDEQGNVVLNNIAAGFEVRFYGTELTVTMSDGKYPDDAYGTGLAVFVDGETDPTANIIHLHRDGAAVDGGRKITLCSFDEPGIHTVKVQKITEEDSGYAKLMSMSVNGELMEVTTEYDLKMMIYGDSITAGYGNTRPDAANDGLTTTTQNGLLTYATIAASELNADVHVLAKSGIGLYTNPYGSDLYLKDVYGKVSALSDTDWDMTKWVPDIVVINVGTNDGWTTSKDHATGGNVVFSKAGFQEAYIDMIQGMVDVWGKDVMFFLCYDMMNTTNNTNIKSALTQVRFSFMKQGVKINVVQLPRTPHGGHPMLEAHRAAANTLLDAIEENYLKK